MIALLAELWKEPITRAILCLFIVSIGISTANLFYGGSRR